MWKMHVQSNVVPMKENMEWQVMFEVCSFIQRTTRDIPAQWSVS